MPDWTEQNIYTRNKEDLEKIRKEFTNISDGEEFLDFNKIIPMPESLKYTQSPNDIEHIAYFLSPDGKELEEKEIESKINDFIRTLNDPTIKEAKDMYQKNYNFETMEKEKVSVIPLIEKFLKDKEAFKEGKERVEEFKEWCEKEKIEANLYNYGKKMLTDKLMYNETNWYDWACNNWGTKWDIDKTYWEDKMLSFQTAWSPALPIYVAISNKLQIDIFAEWFEEQFTEWAGVMQIEKGKVTLFKEFRPNSRELFEVASVMVDEDQDRFRYDEKNKKIVAFYEFEDYNEFDKLKKIKTGNKYLEKFLEEK